MSYELMWRDALKGAAALAAAALAPLGALAADAAPRSAPVIEELPITFICRRPAAGHGWLPEEAGA